MTTILIVEDDPAVQKVLAGVLHLEGYQVLTATHGAAALVQLQQPVDLILSDVLMPGLDGIAFYGHLRADPSYQALPVILISAIPLRRSLSDPHLTFLPKPFDLAMLLATIARMLTQPPPGSDGAARSGS